MPHLRPASGAYKDYFDALERNQPVGDFLASGKLGGYTRKYKPGAGGYYKHRSGYFNPQTRSYVPATKVWVNLTQKEKNMIARNKALAIQKQKAKAKANVIDLTMY